MQITETRNQSGWQRSLRSSSWIMSYSLSSYGGSGHRASLLQEEMSPCTPLKLCQTPQKRKTVATLHQVKMGLPGSCLDHSGQKVMEWIGLAAFNMQREASSVQVFPRVLQSPQAILKLEPLKSTWKGRLTDLFTLKLLKLRALKMCHKAGLTSP